MHIHMMGLHYRNMDLEMREKLALPELRAKALLHLLQQTHPLAEGVVLSTCNRTEIYLTLPADHQSPRETILNWIAQVCEVPCQDFRGRASFYSDNDAIKHLFGVCTGLDSMVLGETEILGQVKRAYALSQEHGFAGPMMHTLFQQALAVSKQARNDSGIDRGRTSVASVAVNLTTSIFSSLKGRQVICAGAGEVAKSALRHLLDLKPAQVHLLNRSPQRAHELATSLNSPLIRVHPLEALDDLLETCSVALFSTAAPHAILSAQSFRPILRKRRGSPLLLLDLALPRDIDAAIGKHDSVFLYNLDDLQEVVVQTEGDRQEKVLACQETIQRGVKSTSAQLQHRDMGYLIKRWRAHWESLAQLEEDRLIQRLRPLLKSPADETDLRELLAQHHHRLLGKLLHQPVSRLNPRHGGERIPQYAKTIEDIFGLEHTQQADKPNLPDNA